MNTDSVARSFRSRVWLFALIGVVSIMLPVHCFQRSAGVMRAAGDTLAFSRSRIKSHPIVTQELQRSSRFPSSKLFSAYGYSSPESQEAAELDEIAATTGYRRPAVTWYPGHIAKAERQLSETLKAVDVVLEVRDARACKATAHPRVGEWCAGRPRIVVLTHLDHIPKPAVAAWQRAYDELGAERWDDAPVNQQVANQAQQAKEVRFQYNTANRNSKKNKQSPKQKESISPVEHVMFVNARQGQGIHALHRAIFKAGAHVQERRERRKLRPRALRVGIIGFPNVGKSALINRILGRRRARTANTPGITRTLQWIRVRADDSKSSRAKDFELLDSPGIIPAKMEDQSDALLLAACNCIGTGAYDNQAVAAYLCEWLRALHIMGRELATAPQWRAKCQERYFFDPMAPTKSQNDDGNYQDDDYYLSGEDMLFLVADNTCKGDPEDAARKILQDFRTGRMGPVSLQLAPETETDDGQQEVVLYRSSPGEGGNKKTESSWAAQKAELDQLQQERAISARETAKERGLELPPLIESDSQVGESDSTAETVDDIGKGMFDGW